MQPDARRMGNAGIRFMEIQMTQFRFAGIAAILMLAAYSSAQDKIKIEPKWDKDSKAKYSLKGSFEVGGQQVEMTATSMWTAGVSDSDTTITIHSDDLKVEANGNDVPVQASDYKVTLDKKGALTNVEGGIEQANGPRMFLITHFFAPSGELTKDATSKWEMPKNEKLGTAAMTVETTYMGEEEVGGKKVLKIKQVVKETGSEFKSEGTFFVTKDGHTVKCDVKFGGWNIPVVGVDASGTFKLTLRD